MDFLFYITNNEAFISHTEEVPQYMKLLRMVDTLLKPTLENIFVSTFSLQENRYQSITGVDVIA